MAAKTGHQEVARRYACAFFALACEQGQTDAVSGDMVTLEKALATGGDFTAFLNNATLKRDDQARALAALAKHFRFSPLTEKLLGTLAARRRLPALKETSLAVQALIAAHKGEVTAEVTAAQALEQSQVAAIADSLKKALGAEVKVKLTVDPAIMGGLIVKVGSRLMDNSVRTKLERLHRALKQTNSTSDAAKMKEVA